MSVVSTMPGYVGKQPVAWKKYCAEYWLKELHESIDRCTGRRDITEILLKTALNTIQLNNQSYKYIHAEYTRNEHRPTRIKKKVSLWRTDDTLRQTIT